jgi:hypothetical protein
MKAEHRHELQTNALANQLGKLVDKVKTAPQSNTTVVYVVIVLAVVLAGAWYFSSRSSGWSELWVKLDGENDVRVLDTIASGSPGTMPGRVARFQKARLLLHTGLRSLFGVDRSRAIQNLEDARQLFTNLAPECAKESLLVQEAMLGAAQAEEALIGIPKEDKSGDRGTLERATELYVNLAEKYPDSMYGASAAKHVAELKTSGPNIEKFYKDLNAMVDAKKKRAPDATDLPPLPPQFPDSSP